MLECLLPLKNKSFDFISFFRDNLTKTVIQGSEYKDFGQKLGGSELGDEYHVLLLRDSVEDNDKWSDLDMFDAILLDPLEYISQLIPDGWCGVVARKTTTSGKIVRDLVALFEKNLYTPTNQ